MQVRNNVLRSSLNVVVDNRERTESHQQYESALSAFKQRHRTNRSS